ncbi:MAG: YbjN domain-containing protein [Acidobacteria bacterium]|nr:YbjN domain-containing protein [Acidobacteriota bacterium]
MGSTAVDITVYAFEAEALVHLRALVVHGARRDVDLYDTLLRQNAQLVVGAFSVDADGDIVVTHTIPAAAVTEETLDAFARGVINVLDVADHFDDFIQGRWGGQRTIDRG